MPKEYSLNIAAEIEYAVKWAYSRNPRYYNFDGLGGDCTNFVSQCIYAGGAVMNYTKDTGWYYSSPRNRAAAWTGVEYFYKFMTNNKGIGPFGTNIPLREVKIGDVIQLGNHDYFYHTLLVVNIMGGIPFVAAHTIDTFNTPLSAYEYEHARCIHIVGYRK